MFRGTGGWLNPGLRVRPRSDPSAGGLARELVAGGTYRARLAVAVQGCSLLGREAFMGKAVRLGRFSCRGQAHTKDSSSGPPTTVVLFDGLGRELP
jgi:hypothetical protein